MKWFLNLPRWAQILITIIPIGCLFLSVFLLDNLGVNSFTIFLFILFAGFSIVVIVLNYKNKKYKNDQKEKQSTNTYFDTKYTCPTEIVRYTLVGTDGKNGRSSRKALARRIFWKDGPFRFPYPIIVTLEEIENTFNVLVNGKKIGEITPEDVFSIKRNYNRIYQLSIEIEHENYSEEYLPLLKIEYYTLEKFSTIPNYHYLSRGQRISNYFSPIFLNEYIVIDIETTGIDVLDNDILEIAALHINDGQVINKFSELCFSQKINTESISINHITQAMVNNARNVFDVLNDFVQFIGDLPIIGHNINYDIAFIASIHPISNKFDDTCILADEFMTGKQNGSIHIANRKLKTLCTALGVEQNSAHRALGDCTATFQCYEKMKTYISSILNIPLNEPSED